MCFNKSIENRESVLNIQTEFEFKFINSRNFNLITWFASVNQVIRQNHFFMSQDSSRLHIVRRLLDC